MRKIDRIDLKILAALQRDGRITKLDLAAEVGLSPAACWDRLRRLEAGGIVAGYSARIDAGRLGRFATVLVEVTLGSHRQDDFRRFEEAMHREESIIGCDAVGGGIDYILRVVATDVDAYQRLIDHLLAADLGIDRYTTYIVTKTVKACGFPLGCIAIQGSGAT